jgi:hypothetical protein
MAISTSFAVGDKEFHLRYQNKQQQDIRANGPEKFLPEGHKIKKFQSPMQILELIENMDVQIYLIEKGLEWEGSGAEKINFDAAADLRQDYLEQGEPDAGEKQEALLQLLIDALALNVHGASGKKLLEKGKMAQAKAAEKSHDQAVEEYARINEARILAQARAAKKLAAEAAGAGTTGIERSPE